MTYYNGKMPNLDDALNRKIDASEIVERGFKEQFTRELFHRLWGKAIRNEIYVKHEWMLLQFLLQKSEVDV